jgi:hypothetical protein
MAKILFKKGTWANLQKNVITGNKATDGALYLTEDEGGLYLGKSDGSVKRISGSVLYFATLNEFENEVKPPYSTDVIYFLADRDALVRWNGEKWIVLNQTAESVTGALESLQDQIDTMTGNLNTVTATANGALQKTGGTMSGAINMGGKAITNLATPSANTDAATKKYVDDKASSLLGTTADTSATETIRGAQVGVTEAKAAAQEAKDAADVADGKAEEAASRAEEMLPLDGSKQMQGNLDVNNFNIVNVKTPTANGHAANKKYVDDEVKKATDAAGVAKEIADTAVANAAAAQATADDGVERAKQAAAAAALASTAATNANNNAESRVKQSVYDAFLVTNTAAIADAKLAGTNAQSAAEAAHDAADDAKDIANTKLPLAGGVMTGSIAMSGNKVTGLGAPSAEGDATNKKYVDDIKTSLNAGITAAQNTANQGVTDAAAALAAANAAQDAAEVAQGEVDALEGVVAGVKSTAEKGVKDAAAANANADSRVLTTTFETFKGTNTTRINEVEGKANAAQDTASAALPKAGGTMTGKITMTGNNAVITGLKAPTANSDAANKKYVDDEVAAAKTYAEGLIASNDAMTFKGVIHATADLPVAANTSKRGDTYKVGTAGTYNNIEARVGDLFINTAADDAVPVWEHVSSGYEDDYLQKLKYDSSKGKLYLTDGVNESYVADAKLGAFLFTGDSDTNLKLSVTPNSGQTEFTITASMEWGSF